MKKYPFLTLLFVGAPNCAMYENQFYYDLVEVSLQQEQERKNQKFSQQKPLEASEMQTVLSMGDLHSNQISEITLSKFDRLNEEIGRDRVLAKSCLYGTMIGACFISCTTVFFVIGIILKARGVM